MNINHLGDAFDFWKGSFIRKLGNTLRNLKVLPMFTDTNEHFPWNNARLELYAELLGVNKQDILRQEVRFPNNTRGQYFQNLDNNSDLFVDPDIGIEPPSGSNYRHIRLTEIAQLLSKSTNRVVLIYQHSFHKDNYIDVCLKKVIKFPKLKDCHTLAYWAGSVSMVFITRDEKRRIDMYKVLYNMTYSLPDNRIHALPPIIS